MLVKLLVRLDADVYLHTTSDTPVTSGVPPAISVTTPPTGRGPPEGEPLMKWS